VDVAQLAPDMDRVRGGRVRLVGRELSLPLARAYVARAPLRGRKGQAVTREEFDAFDARIKVWVKIERRFHRLSLAWIGIGVITAMLGLPSWSIWVSFSMSAACHAAVMAIFDRITWLHEQLIARLERETQS
jgi:hypothetical protein